MGVSTDIIRSSLRRMNRNRRFTATIVVVFVLGIGANAAMFGMVDRLLLRPPAHVENPERVKRVLVERAGVLTGERAPEARLSYPVLKDTESVPGVAEAAAYQRRNAFMGRHEETAEIPIVVVTGDYFRVLGTPIPLGRPLTPADDTVGATPAAVISHGLWQRRHGGAETVLGQTLDLRGVEYTVVGVAPPGFTGMSREAADAWVPLRVARDNTSSWEDNRRNNSLEPVVRLEPGADESAVAARATTVHQDAHRELAEQGRYDPEAGVILASAIPGRGPDSSGESRVAQWLMAVSLLVLIIASANVANLLLARSIQSRRETGVRRALGAPGRRLVVEGVFDGILPAAMGGLLALLVAEWAGSAVGSALLPDMAWGGSIVDLRLIAFVAVLTLLSGLVAGLLPGLGSATADVRGVLADGGRTATGITGWRSALGVLQTTLSVVLLVGAALFIRSLAEARQTDLGFNADRLLVAQPVLDEWWGDDAERARFFQEALRRVETIPAVSSATTAGMTTAFGNQLFLGITRGAEALPEEDRNAFVTAVTAGYFETLGQEIVQGRPILESDQAGARPVVVVSHTMARRLWGDENPLGRCVVLDAFREEVSCAEVVGVAADANRQSLEEADFMHAYLSFPQELTRWGGQSALFIRVRPGTPVDGVASTVRREMISAMPRLRFATVTPMADLIDPLARAWRLGAALFALFGVLALLIAAFGLYSLLAFDVTERRRELAIRAALGATRARLLGSVLTRGVSLTVLGIGLGFAIAALAARHIAPLLFRTDPLDPVALAAVALVLLVSAVGAALVPGRKALSQQPSAALNAD